MTPGDVCFRELSNMLVALGPSLEEIVFAFEHVDCTFRR